MSVFTFSDLAFMAVAAGYTPTDADAAAYIARVEGASGDNQALEPGVRRAIDDFVIGCKADGIWNAIKASCIMAGARTLAGALQPLVGTAPTNFSFVSGDYNRKTGLRGTASDPGTKWLDTNRANNADPQNSKHLCCFPTELTVDTAGTAGSYIGAADDTGSSMVRRAVASTNLITRNNSSTNNTGGVDSIASTLKGVSRSTSSEYIIRSDGANTTATVASATPSAGNITVFRRGTTGPTFAPRIAFYSIGESLDLALLDARVTALINAFAAAIP